MARKKPAKPVPVPAARVELPRKSKIERWFKIILFAFAFVLYGNTLKNGYSLDDLYVTYNNPVVSKGIKAIPHIFTSLYVNINAEEGGSLNFGYRPVAKAMFAVEHEFFGDNPMPSHLVNVILYGLNILLLFVVLRKMLPAYSPWFAFVACLLWAAHPLHTEVVASLKNREEILSLIFALLSTLCFLQYTSRARVGYIVLGALCFLLSLISKPGTLPLIVGIPLILYFFTKARPQALVITTLSLIAVFVAGVLIVKHSMPSVSRPVLFIENPLLFEKNFLVKIASGFYVLLYYLKLLVFPHPLRFYYGYDMIPVVNFSHPLVWLSVGIHGALLAFAIWKIRQRHVLSFAILFYLVSISMFANFVKQPPGIVAERFLYIASIGFCLAVTWLLFMVFRLPADREYSLAQLKYVLLASLVLLVPASLKTIARNPDWKSETSLFAHDLPYLGRSAKAHYIYANALKSKLIDEIKNTGVKTGYESEVAEIKSLLNQTVQIYPGYFEAWNSLGEISSMMEHDYTKALENFGKATETRPRFAPAWFNRGYACQQMGQYTEAIPFYLKAFELDSTDVKALSNLGACYSKTNQLDSAVWANKKMLEIRPQMKMPYVNIVTYYLQHKDTASAVPWLEQLDKIQPGDRRVAWVLYRYYHSQGDRAKTEQYKKVLMQNREPAHEQNTPPATH